MKTQAKIDREIARAKKLIAADVWCDDPEDDRPAFLHGLIAALEWLPTAGGSPTLAIERALQAEAKRRRKSHRAWLRSPEGRALAPLLADYFVDRLVLLPYLKPMPLTGGTASFTKWTKDGGE